MPKSNAVWSAFIVFSMIFGTGCDTSSSSTSEKDTMSDADDSDEDSEKRDTMSDADDSDEDSDRIVERPTETEASISVTVRLPDDFDGKPQILVPYFFETKDFQEPDQEGEFIHHPDISVNEPLSLDIGQSHLSGDYYLALVLYCEGGGEGDELVSGVDWYGATPEPISLDPMSGTVDAGTIELFMYEESQS